jgi:hypothetical protein
VAACAQGPVVAAPVDGAVVPAVEVVVVAVGGGVVVVVAVVDVDRVEGRGRGAEVVVPEVDGVCWVEVVGEVVDVEVEGFADVVAVCGCVVEG